jgi:diphthine-ammonia ligase
MLPECLESRHMSLSNVVGVALWMRDLSQFAAVNKVFSSRMQKSGGDPPVRACLEVGLPEQWPILLEATAQKTPQEYLLDSEQPEIPKQALHVQSLSHWAPASIGPYSQAVKVDCVVQVAGQIALDPSSGQLLEGAGVEAQCLLALRHVSRILAAMNSRFELQDVVQVIFFLRAAVYYILKKTNILINSSEYSEIWILLFAHFCCERKKNKSDFLGLIFQNNFHCREFAT